MTPPEVSRRDILILSRIPGVGPARLRSLISHFNGTAPIFQASPGDLLKAEGVDRRTALSIATYLRQGIPSAATQFANDQLRRIERAGGRILTFWDAEYPEHLTRIYDPPPFLFLTGSLIPRDTAALALVGTRTPTPYGLRMAERMAMELAARGITIVSGLARGIDTIAHGAALKAGGRTVAIIGSGIDTIYPTENSTLAHRLASHGALISEFIMGAKPDATNFPQRNRIISGMSLGTLVVETGVEGGAMITARLALDQNREVFAIPSPVTPGTRSGTNLLIREGNASLVETVEDVLQELAPKLKGLVADLPVQHQPPLPPLTLFEQKLADVLDDHPQHIDIVAEHSGFSTSEALVHLLSLEFKGVARQLPGKLFLKG
jgi:DNA processing protein